MKKILTAFEINARFIKNEKALMKFPVSLLEACSEDMLIIIFDKMGKKLFNKKSLVKRLIEKFNGLLPSKCEECSDIYFLELKDDPLFICNECQRGSHNCNYLKEFKSSLTGRIPKGFIWLCFDCCSEHDIKNEDASHVNGVVDKKKNTCDHQSDEESSRNSPASNAENRTSSILKPPSTTVVNDCDEREITMNNKTAKKATCRFYIKKQCKHGLKGNKCSYDHPKLCYKFIKNGISHGGCQDKACLFYHPKLCWESMRNRVCNNLKCKFYHLKGIKVRQSDDQRQLVPTDQTEALRKENRILRPLVTKSSHSDRNNQREVRYSDAVRGHAREQSPHFGITGSYYGTRTADTEVLASVNSGDFLELRRQVQMIAQQISDLALSNVKMGRFEDQWCPKRTHH